MTNLLKNILFIIIGFYTTSCGWLNENPDTDNSAVSENENNVAISEEKNSEKSPLEVSGGENLAKKTSEESKASTKEQKTARKISGLLHRYSGLWRDAEYSE